VFNTGSSKTRTFMFTVALTLALMVVSSITASAQGKPARIYIGGEFDVPVPDSCAFPINQHFNTNNEYILIFPGDHPLIVTGQAKATISNEITGKSLDLNISGPALITPSSTTTTVTLLGRSTLFVGNHGGMWLTSGPVVVLVDANNQIISYSMAAPDAALDLCQALA